MKIGVDMGHPLNCGAKSILNETTENRKIGNELIRLLEGNGHTIVNCTVDSNTGNELANRVALANKQSLDLYVSIHLNAGGGHGTETFTCRGASSKTKAIAQKVNYKIIEACGFRNRGIKESNFYVLLKTVAPAILIEVCFVDSQEDNNKLNTKLVAKAIAEGITNESYEEKPNKDEDQEENNNSNGEIFYRVVAGSFKDRKNAEKAIGELKEKGFNAFVDILRKQV